MVLKTKLLFVKNNNVSLVSIESELVSIKNTWTELINIRNRERNWQIDFDLIQTR